MSESRTLLQEYKEKKKSFSPRSFLEKKVVEQDKQDAEKCPESEEGVCKPSKVFREAPYYCSGRYHQYCEIFLLKKNGRGLWET